LIIRRSVFHRDLQGEMCVAANRVYLQEGIYDRFEKKLADRMKSWVVGDPFDPRVNQGPQVKINQTCISLFFVHEIGAINHLLYI
jgi:acyl-CoA reductase-like NAD-dependent aldehyde dehydrogenase